MAVRRRTKQKSTVTVFGAGSHLHTYHISVFQYLYIYIYKYISYLYISRPIFAYHLFPYHIYTYTHDFYDGVSLLYIFLHPTSSPNKVPNCDNSLRLFFALGTFGFKRPKCATVPTHRPGDSKCPFHPLVGGHLTFPKGHLTIPKRSL